MVGGGVPARVDFNSASADFWKRYHDYRRARQEESRPDDPQLPDEIAESTLKRENPFDIEYRYEMSLHGNLLSWFAGSTSKPGTPGHDSNKHLFWADLYVRPDHRRQGIASSWLPLLLELMDECGCTVVGFGTEDAPGHAFLKWMGAQARLTGAENRLKLADVDWTMIERWMDEGRARSPQTMLEAYDGPLPEAMWDDFVPQFSSLLNTMPWENLDHGEIVITADHMRDWYARVAIRDERMHSILTREPDGLMSSITEAAWAPHRPAIVEQRFTGVRPDARGRGLGKWIKAAMLRHLHELYPKAEWIVTENAGSNAPMLAINKMLGFKEYRAGAEYQISRDDLAAVVKRLAPR